MPAPCGSAVSTKPPKWVTLGHVSGVFGVKGWLKVRSYTVPPGNIVAFAAWTLVQRTTTATFEVEAGREHGNGVVAKLRGLNDRDRAAEWVGAEVRVERERLPALAPGEFYWVDLEGLEVRTMAGAVLGRVTGLTATPGHDLLMIGGAPERLIPFVMGQTIRAVDIEAGVIVVDWSADDE